MSGMLHLTDDDLERQIAEAELPVLVDFWGDDCPPCERLAPIYQELAQDYRERVVFAKLHTGENARVSNKLSIRGTPTLILFKDGAVADTIIGFRPKVELQEWLDSAL
jgi:thioredoxin 1